MIHFQVTGLASAVSHHPQIVAQTQLFISTERLSPIQENIVQ